MRADVGDVGEQRPIRRLRVEPLAEPLGEEGGFGVLGRVHRGRPRRAAVVGVLDVVALAVHRIAHSTGRGVVPTVAQPRSPFLQVLGQVDLGPETRQHALVGPEPPVVGIVDAADVDGRVGVAEERGFVAERRHLEREVRETVVERRAVADRAMHVEVGAGQQRGTTGSARRTLRVVAGEAHAPRCQRVDVGRDRTRMAGTREAVGAPLVDRDEHDVELLGHGGRLRNHLAHGAGISVMPCVATSQNVRRVTSHVSPDRMAPPGRWSSTVLPSRSRE